MTTGSDDVREMLEAIQDQLQHLSIEQKTADPKREKKVDELRKQADDAIQALKAMQRREEDDDRLAAFLEAMTANTYSFLDAINANTASAYDLQVASDRRLRQLEKAVLDRAGIPFDRKDEIEAEGEYLRDELAGLPLDSTNPRYFKDVFGGGPRPAVSSGIDALALAVVQARAVGAKQQQSP